MSLEDEYLQPEKVEWEGKYISARTRGRWEYVTRTRNIRAAVIIAIDDQNRIILVSQFRIPLGKHSLEMPAGLIGDDEGGEGEDAAIAAVRELEEETGYRAGRMESLGEFYSSPGMVGESFTLFRAHDLVKVSEGGGLEGEEITVHHVPLPETESFIAARRAEGWGMDSRMMLLLAGRFMAPLA
jgi:ADP-ribose pyrophosphatase